MAGSKELEPPADISADPGAHQLAEHSDSEDQFTDAQSAPMSPNDGSPIPKTRVEKVDDEPAHGEVPGTDAHTKRQEDAQPDEIAVQKEEESEDEDKDEDEEEENSEPSDDVPVTVVEEAPGATPRSTKQEENSKEDASPDIVIPSSGEVKGDSPEDEDDEDEDDDANEDDNDFGDDFDDFEEGAEGEDFDDFEDGFQEPVQPAPAPQISQPASLPFPIPDLDGLSYEDILSATEPQLASLFPPEELDLPEFPPLPKDTSAFTTQRSASLWSQLVAPPPLAPPDWIRSRTRRLFLVSLGVPVDLDEILPASKQKKLVLPSLNVPSSTSPRNSSDSRSVSRLRQGEGNNSSTSVDTQGKPKKRKGPPPQPEFNLVAVRHMCTTTDEALDGMTIEELKAHVQKLQALESTAKEALEYWQKRTDEKVAEKDSFEGVIENLVKHARKVRK